MIDYEKCRRDAEAYAEDAAMHIHRDELAKGAAFAAVAQAFAMIGLNEREQLEINREVPPPPDSLREKPTS